MVISDSYLSSEIGSLEECAELFADCPEIYVAGGISPFDHYDGQLEGLEKYISKGLVCGVKIYCGHEPVYLCCSILEPVYGLALKYGVPVMFHSGWNNGKYSGAEIIRAVAGKYPGVKFICCHCCYPDLSRCFEMTAEFENVYYDISSLAEVTELYPEISREVVRAVKNMPYRMIFGSDFGGCDQGRHIEFCMGLGLSDSERKLLFYENAVRIFGITNK